MYGVQRSVRSHAREGSSTSSMAEAQGKRLRKAAQQLADCSDDGLEAACSRMRALLSENPSSASPETREMLRDIRWDTAFSVDAAATNDDIHQKYLARERDARQQVRFASYKASSHPR